MLTTTRSLVASNREAAKLVEAAQKFSIRLPLIGKVSVPPPDQLAFYGALGLLAAVELIDWPVALAIGVGQAVMARHLAEQRPDESKPAAAEKGAKKAQPRKASARKAQPRKAAKATKASGRS
ncbi:MAG: hypothetical protein WAM92_03505 [Mycobacterium sp.]